MTHTLAMVDSIGAALLAVIGFGLIIFIHELGHFLVAKGVGIKVTQFALGFGPSMVSWRKGIGLKAGSTEPTYDRLIADKPELAGTLGETEYRINWVMLGGYVKMLGQEDMDPTAQSEDPRSYNQKSVGARAAVISAGVIMNLISAVIFFWITFMAGKTLPPPILGEISDNYPAAHAMPQGHDDPSLKGLQVGDRLVSINGQPAEDFTDLAISSALGSPDEPLLVEVRRPQGQGVEGGQYVYPIVPRPNPNARGRLTIGAGFPVSLEVADVSQMSEFAGTGLEQGMRLVAVHSQPIEHFYQFHRLARQARNAPIELTFAHVQEPSESDSQAHAASSKTVTLTRHARPSLVREVDEEGNPTSTVHLLGFVPATEIVSLVGGSPAEGAGFEVGDLVARVVSVDWPSNQQLIDAVGQAGPGATVSAKLLRGDESVSKTLSLNRNGKMGIGLAPATNVMRVAHTLPDSPAGELNLPPGSTLLAVNDTPVSNYADLQAVLQKLAEQAPDGFDLTLRYRMNLADSPEGESTLTVSAQQAQRIAKATWDAPMLPLMMRAEPPNLSGPFDALRLGLTHGYKRLIETYLFLHAIVQGNISFTEAAGPVRIAHFAYRASRSGWQDLLFLMGIISVSLAVVNMLPIPVLDGGHLLFLLIEKIRGKPLPAHVVGIAMYVGLGLIGLLMLTILYSDVFIHLLGW